MRLDQLLTHLGLVEAIQTAQVLIMAGEVLVDGQKVIKPSQSVKGTSMIEIVNPLKYVSRGGLKLEHAVSEFKVDVKDKICMDIGSSTGGFTDYLLQNGAKKVYAVDVGKGLLHWKLQKNEKIVLLEEVNFRYFQPDSIKEDIGLFTIDVSFISLDKILPKVKEVSKGASDVVALIKPQFEAGRGQAKKGIVRDEQVRILTVEKIKNISLELGFTYKQMTESPIKGAKGNVEYFIYLGV